MIEREVTPYLWMHPGRGTVWRARLIGCSIAQMGSLTTSSEKLRHNWRFE
jgi:hypothetical protein